MNDVRSDVDIVASALENGQHVCCCLDENVGFCGLDLTDVPFAERPTTCVVCAELDGTGFCPKFGACRGAF